MDRGKKSELKKFSETSKVGISIKNPKYVFIFLSDTHILQSILVYEIIRLSKLQSRSFVSNFKRYLHCCTLHVLLQIQLPILAFLPESDVKKVHSHLQTWHIHSSNIRPIYTSLGTNTKILNFEHSEHWMSEHRTFRTSHFGPKSNFEHVEHHKKPNSSRTSNCKFQD